jgi:uncharacterized protein (TIGR02145 family)
MRENLNVGTMINGSIYSGNNSIIEKYCFNNDTNNCTVYGGLYQWDEMMSYVTTAGTQGICPNGWHIPTDAEWCTLTIFLDSTVNCGFGYYGYSGIDVGGKMKEAGFDHWDSPNTGATNSSGFTALGAGERESNGTFPNGLRNSTTFWSSSEGFYQNYGETRNLYFTNSDVGRGYNNKAGGLSVRCLKN